MSDTRASVPSWRDDPAWPDVDVVMPIRDEADHLVDAVAAVRRQAYPGRLQTFVAVGPSTDGTERVAAELARAADDLVVLANPSGRTPEALNIAIRAGTAPVVVRVDGHSELADGYIRRAVETLRRTGAANVGGRQVPVAQTPIERAVATATTSWLGTGGPAYRVGGAEGAVDTVYLGVFDRAAIESVGLFDERFVRNQDYELNIRLRQTGRAVWFDPELAVGYRPRGSWRALASQYFEYGRWKGAVMRVHPDSARMRQLVPPVAMTGVAGGLALWRVAPRARVVPLAYAATVVGSALVAARSVPAALRIARATITIHVAWSAGLLSSLLVRRSG